MPSSRIIFPIALCVSFSSPSLAQEAKKTAEPITLANVDKVGLLSEVKHTSLFLELGPGPNELLLFPRNGILVVDDTNLKVIREIDKDQTQGFSFSQDRRLTSWLQDMKTIIHDEKTGKNVKIDAAKSPGSAVFSPDNKLIAIGEAVSTNTGTEGSGFSVMRVFDTATGEMVHMLDTGHEGYGAVRPVFSPDGKLLAVSNRNYETRIFEVATGKQLRVLPKRMTQEIAFSPDGKSLAAAYVDGHLGLWDVESGKSLHMVESGCPEIYSVAWNSTGDLLATCSPASGKHGPNNTFIRMPGKVQLWNAKTFKVAKELMDVQWSGRVRFTHDNTRIVATVRKKETLDDSPRIAIWSTNAPAIATSAKPNVDVPTIPVEYSLSLPPMSAPTVAVSSDGKRVFLNPTPHKRPVPATSTLPLFRRLWHKIEPIFVSKLAASHVDDLLRVAFEMRHGIKDGGDTRHVETLNAACVKEVCCCHVFQRGLGFGHGCIQPLEQFHFGNWTSLRKLTRPVPCVFDSTNTSDDPLADISAQMKNQISDAVHRFRWSPPNLFLGELVQAMCDFVDSVVEEHDDDFVELLSPRSFG